MADEPIGDKFDESDSNDNGSSSDSSSQQSHEDAAADGIDKGKFFTAYNVAHPINLIIDRAGDETDRIGDVDSTDANAFEAILGERNFSSVVTPELEQAHEHQSSSPPPEPSFPEARNPDARPTLFVERFSHGHPGAPLDGTHQGPSTYGSTRHELGDSVWAPFRSQCDWEFARWAKTCGATASAVTALLAIPEAIFGNPEFARELVFAPERHYTDAERTCRVYNEMYTADWWWSVQTSLEARRPGATVIPLIISSDKTQLTLFRNKEAYPVYMGIGNIPKDVRRKPSRYAQMLIGYIPTTKLAGITNKAARRRAVANLFHSCMEKVLGPINAYGETGIAMLSGDGTWRRCHPIFATFVGDYPEQGLVTCTRYGRCPKCLVPADQLGVYTNFPARNHVDVVDTYMSASEDIRRFRAVCREAGLKPVFRPFWNAFPLVDIFLSITPDVLHQLLQGVVKHVKAWLIAIFGTAEIDARCRSLPPNHHITLFAKGITTLSRISGKEHKSICRFLLGLIIDLAIPGGQLPSRVIRAVRALLDFVYLAQYPSHTRQTLQRLEECLARFHENKDVFIDLGVRRHMLIPKIHSLLHYRSSITLFGTTDNYNTEQSERLHIDFTKDAYRATNRKDEYTQMTAWLERREKVRMHTAFVELRTQSHLTSPPISTTPIGPLQVGTRFLKMTQHPTVKAVTFDELAMNYGAVDFQDALADFIALINYPSASAVALRSRAADTLLPFRTVPVFHRVKFSSREKSEDSEIVDSVVIRPEQKDAHGRTVPERFDTVLVRGRQDVMHGNNGNRIGQVRVVFQIPSKVIHDIFLNDAPTHLAYIEWFSPLSPTPDANHLMYKVSRLFQGGRRRATVIPVDDIMGSVHLIPRFGRATPQDWNSFSVLERCSTFYVNPFSDRDNYLRFS
ncbi:hypothetical protein EDB84DRAFT_1666988 [Lactarius hengduanensis]|nr:hypothetical protein EDB84DRAFT_1666988 [Lactarius hengduanensis]